MWAVLDYFGIYFTRISHSCKIFKVDPPAVATVIGLVGGILFSLGAVGRRYMGVAISYALSS